MILNGDPPMGPLDEYRSSDARRHPSQSRITALSFEASDSPNGQAGPSNPKPYNSVRRSSLHNTSVGSASGKRIRTSSGISNDDIPSPRRRHSRQSSHPSAPGESSGPSERHRKTSRTSKKGKRDVRSIDYGLGILDEPSRVDPVLEAQVAELHRRVQHLDLAALPTPPLLELESRISEPLTPPPPPIQFPPTVEPAPRIPQDTGSNSQHSTQFTSDNHFHHTPPDHRRRRISGLFSDVKDKVKGKQRESPAKRHAHFFNGPLAGLHLAQAEERIKGYRERLKPSTIERAESAKIQLGRRYSMIFDALAAGTDPPNLLAVVKWRRGMADSRRHQDMYKSPARRSLDAPSQPNSISTRMPLAIRSNSTLDTIDEGGAGYLKEAYSLQWLPYLANLHEKYSSPVAGRKEMRDWHVTAQVVADFVHWIHSQGGDTRTPSAGITLELAKSRSPPMSFHYPQAVESRTSLEHVTSMIATEPSSPRGSLDHDLPRSNTGHTNLSGRTGGSGRGFRVSLGGLRDFQFSGRSVPSLFGASSPPLGPGDLSPNSSRRDLARRRIAYLSDDAVSIASGSDPAGHHTDGSDPDRPGAQKYLPTAPIRTYHSASDDDVSRLKRPIHSRASSRRWRTPLFSRQPPEEEKVDESYDMMEQSANTTLSNEQEAPLDYKALRESLLYFANTSANMTEDQSSRASHEDAERRQHAEYANRAKLVHHMAEQNARLSDLVASAASHISEFALVRKLISGTLPLVNGDSDEDDDFPSDVIDAFTSSIKSAPVGWKGVEAHFAHRQQKSMAIRSFIQRAESGTLSCVTVPQVDDMAGTIANLFTEIHKLENQWAGVGVQLDQLRMIQSTISGVMAEVHPFFNATAAKIDTTYPELGQNADLSRHLSVNRQSMIPYISKLPPWAREALGPVIDYTLELVGALIRWLLYPLWRLLPRFIQIGLAFILIFIVACLSMLTSLIGKYWYACVSFGQFLARYKAFRVPTLAAILVLRRLSRAFVRHWQLSIVSTLLALFWYITTPTTI